MARRISLGRDDRGSVTIELALIAPILATMLIGLVDIGTAYSHKLRLEQIANRAIEKVQQDGFDPSWKVPLEAEAMTAAGAGSTASLTYWLECAGTKVANYDAGCAPGQSVARYVQVELVKSHMPIISARFGGASNADGSITVRGVAGVRIQ